jgi:hypothetical protein
VLAKFSAGHPSLNKVVTKLQVERRIGSGEMRRKGQIECNVQIILTFVAVVLMKHFAFKCYIYSANLSLLDKECHLFLEGASYGGIAALQSTAVLNGSLRGSEMCL